MCKICLATPVVSHFLIYVSVNYHKHLCSDCGRIEKRDVIYSYYEARETGCVFLRCSAGQTISSLFLVSAEPEFDLGFSAHSHCALCVDVSVCFSSLNKTKESTATL